MHDVHVKPPEVIKQLFKQWRKHPDSGGFGSTNLVDPSNPDPANVAFLPDRDVDEQSLLELLVEQSLQGQYNSSPARVGCHPPQPFEIHGLPGLHVFPSLLPPRVQLALLDRLLHRDLSNPVHKTNLHLHHLLEYPLDGIDGRPSSFFATPRDTELQPKNSSIHKKITYTQMLESKLRWITLGGQYDWTNKIYPNETPPPFPPDIAAYLKSLFPSIEAQAAIVNFYSPGDTLSVHRDVSEQCDRDLVSISLGCEGIFLVGNDDGSHVAAMRLRSGDAILMSGESRYAWHGVPKILAGTCPHWLQDWPGNAGDGPFTQWKGWMNNKRVNLNVRQMTETIPADLGRPQELAAEPA